jgi:mono/diheme cytochrome c family protein
MQAKQLPRQRRWWLLILALAASLAVIAAACSDDDFDDAPDDRGAAAAATVGAELPVDEAASDEQAADQQPAETESEADAAADEAVMELLSGDAQVGGELFIANGCNLCHGDSGEGNIGPTIAQTGFTLDKVIAQYRNPRGFMPPFLESQVSDAQVEDIYAWLQTQPLPDTIVPGEGTP